MKQYLIPENGQFYKANMHNHSNVSDGSISPICRFPIRRMTAIKMEYRTTVRTNPMIIARLPSKNAAQTVRRRIVSV